MYMYLIIPHIGTLSIAHNLPNDLWGFLFSALYIPCKLYTCMQYNQHPVTHPFNIKGVHVCPRREGGGRVGGGYTGKINTGRCKVLFEIIYTLSAILLDTCSRPWRVDFSTILNSFKSIFTVSSGTPFVKQNSKRSEES